MRDVFTVALDVLIILSLCAIFAASAWMAAAARESYQAARVRRLREERLDDAMDDAVWKAMAAR